MPRDGSNVYSADWVNAAPNTTIESSKQNAMVADFVADANAARPITAGGTGGVTAAAARTALAVPGLEDANTFTANQTLTSTEAGATVGPVLELYRNSASPASNDILGQLLFNGQDSAGNTQEYGSIQAVISDATSTSEDGGLAIYAMVGGARTLISTFGPGFVARGTTSNDLAAAGFIGEFVSNSATTGTLTTATDTNITSIALTAGDWDITAGYTASGTGTPSVTDVWVSINTSSASSVNTAGQSARTRGFTMTDPIISGAVGPLRVSLSGNATYYLNTTCTYTGGGATLAMSGIIRARRVR